jgi:hypothetical protein
MSVFRLVNTQLSFTVANDMKESDMMLWFMLNVPDFHPDGRYVALEDRTGDCIIYEKGIIDRVSDSG